MDPPQSASLAASQAGEAAPAAIARSTSVVNALVHLHRAEVGRLTAYRARMDTTTNWAITTSALITTFAFGNAEISHVALLFLMLVNLFFLQLEARRFRAYETSRHRAQLMEQCFYLEILGEPVTPDWSQQLVASLRAPGPRVPQVGAIGWRLRRSYLGILLAVFVAWLGKLFLSAGATLNLDGLLARAAIAIIPGWLVALAVTALALGLAGLAWAAPRLYPAGDDEAYTAPVQTPNQAA